MGNSKFGVVMIKISSHLGCYGIWREAYMQVIRGAWQCPQTASKFAKFIKFCKENVQFMKTSKNFKILECLREFSWFCLNQIEIDKEKGTDFFYILKTRRQKRLD